jgi:hypothetical protein
MKRLATVLLLAVLPALLIAVPASAQRGERGPDPATRATFEGTIVDARMEPGEGRPTLLIEAADSERTSVRLGPYWMLEEGAFTASVGDAVRVVAYECTRCDADVVAGRVENLTTGAVVELRDDEGMPLWKGRGRGKGPRGDGWGRGPGMRHGKKGLGPGSGQGPGRGPGDGTGPRCSRSTR